MNLDEKQLSAEYIYKGKIINLRRDNALMPDGNTALREVVEHPGGVCVVALDEENNILLVEQYRYPYSERVLEIPAGKRDHGKNEDPLVCGKRELLEETGMTAKQFISLGKFYPTPGYTNEVIYIYFAKDLTFVGQNLDSDEFLSVKKIPAQKLVEMIVSGEIVDGKTIAGVLKAKELKLLY